ncbi:MAG: hypothetical protein LBI13_11135, partial [Streptococcaceae bacterium]|nr:hypothetical protein [Streptococcaceae bacterium]
MKIHVIGKLFDDYHQKKGLRAFYYKLAFSKIMDVKETGRHGRIVEICTDCYIRALNLDEEDVADRLFSDMINNHKKDDETKIRLELNYLFHRLKRALDTYHNNENKLDGIIKQFKMQEKLIDSLDDRQNERAYAIRTIQQASLLRNLIELCLEHSVD